MTRRKRKATTRKKSTTTTKTTKKENIRLIDELYTGERVDNKDLMGSFAKFKNKK